VKIYQINESFYNISRNNTNSRNIDDLITPKNKDVLINVDKESPKKNLPKTPENKFQRKFTPVDEETLHLENSSEKNIKNKYSNIALKNESDSVVIET
jgi:hypothetical protein